MPCKVWMTLLIDFKTSTVSRLEIWMDKWLYVMCYWTWNYPHMWEKGLSILMKWNLMTHSCGYFKSTQHVIYTVIFRIATANKIILRQDISYIKQLTNTMPCYYSNLTMTYTYCFITSHGDAYSFDQNTVHINSDQSTILWVLNCWIFDYKGSFIFNKKNSFYYIHIVNQFRSCVISKTRRSKLAAMVKYNAVYLTDTTKWSVIMISVLKLRSLSPHRCRW